MTFIDVVQLLGLIVSLFTLIVWCVKMRHLPLVIAVIVAMLVNVSFFAARSLNWLQPAELNIISALRVLLLTSILAAVPFTIGRHS